MSPAVLDMIKSAKATVAFFHRFVKATEELKELQAQLKLPERKPTTDCPTWWNSTYYMLQRLLEQKDLSMSCAAQLEVHKQF